MITIGVDPSTVKLAYTILEDGDLLEIRRVGLSGNLDDRAVRAFEMTHNVVRQFSGYDEIRFWIEMPLVGRGGVKVTIDQSYIGGVVMASARLAGAVKVERVNVSTWKAKVLGNGHYPKEKIPAWIDINWNRLHQAACDLSRSNKPDPDICDSGCIARYGYLLDVGAVAPPVKKKRKRATAKKVPSRPVKRLRNR